MASPAEHPALTPIAETSPSNKDQSPTELKSPPVLPGFENLEVLYSNKRCIVMRGTRLRDSPDQSSQQRDPVILKQVSRNSSWRSARIA